MQNAHNKGIKRMGKTSSNNIVGVDGEYYDCAELSRRGHLALLTPNNNPLLDVIAGTPDGSKTVSIQVKTRSIRNKQGWKLGKYITDKKGNPRGLNHRLAFLYTLRKE